MEETPFPDLNIDSFKFLEKLEGRQKCPKCGHSRKYYCYTCFVPIAGTEDEIPKVELPIKVDIIKHPNEVDGKSTSAHAAILARNDVTVYTYPVIPDYDSCRVLLVFPADDSLTLQQYALKYCQPLPRQELSGRITDDAPNSDSKQSLHAQPCQKPRLREATDDSFDNATGESQVHSPRKLTVTTAENVVKLDKQSQLTTNSKLLDGQSKQSVPLPVPVSADDNSHDPTSDAIVATGGCKRLADDCDQPGVKKRAVELEKTRYRPPFDRVVFIDSTWHQVYKMRTDERLKGLQKIELNSRETKFWRHQQDKPNTYLSTIEAVYYFLREYHDLFVAAPYTGQYDNILFFFCFTYSRIRVLYEGGKHLKAYQKDN